MVDRRIRTKEEEIGDPRYDKAFARVEHEAEVNEIIAQWTRQHTKEEAMALISGAGVPVGAVFDSMELTNEPSFYERGILQTMWHGDWKMTMTTWQVRFDGAPAPIKPARCSASTPPKRSAIGWAWMWQR